MSCASSRDARTKNVRHMFRAECIPSDSTVVKCALSRQFKMTSTHRKANETVQSVLFVFRANAKKFSTLLSKVSSTKVALLEAKLSDGNNNMKDSQSGVSSRFLSTPCHVHGFFQLCRFGSLKRLESRKSSNL